METINCKNFQKEYQKILDKMEAIIKLPGSGNPYLNAFDTLEIDSNSFRYHTSHYDGCDNNNFCLEVSYDDINKPLTFFSEKFAEQERIATERSNAIKQREKEKQDELDRKTYERLKQKFN